MVKTSSILTAKEIKVITKEMTHYDDKSAVAIDALKIVQQQRGWVSDEVLKATAELLEMSPDQLDGVATFYNLIYRQPVGQKVIHYCNSVSCWLMGADDICTHISEQLAIKPGETTADGQYTLLPIVCLGDCDHAPVMLIGDQLHGNLDNKKLAKLFNKR
jgi:NADH-quinone oxidoreductase subunit E